MDTSELRELFRRDNRTQVLGDLLKNLAENRIHISGLTGSSKSLLVAAIFEYSPVSHLVVFPEKEAAAYFFNDLENIFHENDLGFHKKNILFFPTAYKKNDEPDSIHLLMRTEVLKRLGTRGRKCLIVTHPEALCDKVIRQSFLERNILRIKTAECFPVDDLADLLIESNFERCDFVYEPGQFSLRGGILDVFSFSNDYPYRIEFSDNVIESIRSFNPSDQLSVDKLDHVSIIPNLQDKSIGRDYEAIFRHLSADTVVWLEDMQFIKDQAEKEYKRALNRLSANPDGAEPESALLVHPDELPDYFSGFSLVEFGNRYYFKKTDSIQYRTEAQPGFNKNFELLINRFFQNSGNGIRNIIFSGNPNQLRRLYTILDDVRIPAGQGRKIEFETAAVPLHEGFSDPDLGIACYTDHQIFGRYHKFHLSEKYSGKEALTIRELYNLEPGDYVTHIDHGIGRYDGLEKIANNGREQEAIRLIYKNDDILYVSIHSLHRISKYTGKEGTVPQLNRLGSNAWNKLKENTKRKVKDIARELIELYAKRKNSEGTQFSPDTYLQHELEASFIYEDTPDQIKATLDVKKDMEAAHPMDRLICGDVGFGKTEIAIRSAFKAVADSRQVAVLVPTTILALQHFKTFTDRLAQFPCRIEYISRFKDPVERKHIIRELKEGSIDIIIGTHRLISKDVEFKNLGLLIVDEEQKFGVSAKEWLKKFKVNVDTLTLTATPIPRTLQFSLMGARDLSVIQTPPPNRYPIQTEMQQFSEEVIREAILYEVERGGQVFFVHNRVYNIMDVATMIRKFCPGVRIAIGHGQLEGHKLEKIMLDFIQGDYDVLVATTIIESGLDIPNVNTIIINDAQNFGLSDLHQLRGRVGRTNKKAFCYLLTPPLSLLTDEARKRLRAIEEFSGLGSGFNIAMRDLDIRGAGNLLGAEQSGFISEIGFEMYHKILDEAIRELKETEFAGLTENKTLTGYVRDCQIETDLSVLIPDDYVINIAERLNLYKELDSIREDGELQLFRLRLLDRFGKVPPETEELINVVRLRWMARDLGFERIVIRNERFSGYFINNNESPYFQSELFGRILEFIKTNPGDFKIREDQNLLKLFIFNIRSIREVIDKLALIIPVG